MRSCQFNKPVTRVIAFAAVAVIAAATPAFADDPMTPTQEIVVTATRIPTPVVDIPAGVTVIDRQTIDDRGYTTLTDALSAVPGVRVSQSGGPGGNASVFVRGTDSNHVLVLRDGMPLNDASDSSGAFNFGVDTLADVERIEVIRGPMAALYGSGAIGGVINLISRQGHEQGLHFTGDLAGGYPKQIQGYVNASGIADGLDYSATFESQSERGYDTTPQRESIYTGVPDGFRAMVGTINLGYTPIDGTRFSVFLRARQALFGFNALGDPTFDDSNSTGQDDELLGRIGVASKLFNGTYETSVYLGRLQGDRQYTETLNPLDPNQASNDSRYHSYRTDLQWNNTVHLGDLMNAPMLSATDLTFGYEHTADNINVKVISSSGGFPFNQGARAAMTDNATYAGLQSTLLQRLTLTGQVRQDWVDNNSPFTWRLGAVLNVPELDTRFKAAYGTAFRAPSLFDRFGVDSFGYIGNPNLKPESAQGWEAGFTTTLDAFARSDFVSFTATYFNEQIQNLIVAQLVPVDTAVNIGSAHIQGVETELTLHPAGWLLLDATYTFTDAQNADAGSRLLRRPQNTASFDATITPIAGLSIVPELLFTGAFQDFLVDDNGNSTGTIVASPDGLIANLTVTYDVAPHVQLYANGRNLFYSRFEPVNGYQTPGPSFLAGVRVKL
ncbi:MAG TPA: TonB-dependent receptor [Acetobacteraceae bacterium]|nr:TonB-dependent receptor [Acetobacteraceae bacterium]